MSHTLFLRARKIVIALGAVATLSLAQVSHAAFSQVVTFGDSLSDAGNVFLATGGATPPAPYFGGRFSNGLIWTENLATSLGLAAPTPSLAGGTANNFGGARTLVDGAVPSTATQAAGYIGANSGAIDPNALYTVWSGGNDVNFGSSTNDLSVVPAAANGVATIVQDLINAGAKSIMVVNLPDIGLTPLGQDSGNPAGATFLSNFFNSTLDTALAGLTLGSANVELLDAFSLTANIAATVIADPNPLTNGTGLSNVTDRCFDAAAVGGPTLCANPDEYLFWDDLHPTAAAHILVADEALIVANTLMAAAVPVPAAAWMFLSALGVIGGLKSRTKTA